MNAPEQQIALDSTARQRIAALADTLMPGGDGLPLPSEIDIHHHWLDEALAAAPALAESLRVALDVDDSPAGVVDKLRTSEPEVFMTLSFVLSGAYFMHPTVRKALGYDGQAISENPPLEGEAEYYLEDGLLDPVITRGRIYRPTPDELANASGENSSFAKRR